MLIIFETPINSPFLIALTVCYFITSSITVFDKRLFQAVRNGDIPEDEAKLPYLVSFVWWFQLLFGLAIVLLNWQFAIVIFISKFILSVLPVLELIGNVIMAPFRPK